DSRVTAALAGTTRHRRAERVRTRPGRSAAAGPATRYPSRPTPEGRPPRGSTRPAIRAEHRRGSSGPGVTGRMRRVNGDSPSSAAEARHASGRQAALAAMAAYAPGAAAGRSTIVLVEGASDRAALSALAARAGRRLHDEGAFIVPMGGATNIGHFLDLLGPRGLGIRVAGLCDAAEEPGFRRGLQRAGLGSVQGRGDLERAGFFVCVADLEDELIRALGTARTEQLVEEQGELDSFRILQQQPAQRNRTQDQQLHRFMGSRGGRKIHYARLLAERLDRTCIPKPLERLLAFI